MPRFSDIFSDFRKTLALSALFHLLLFLAFMAIKIGFDFEPAEFAEISFVSAPEGRSTADVFYGGQRSGTRDEAREASAMSAQQSAIQATPVELPKRRMLEEQDEEKLNNALGKITPDLTSPQRQVSPEQYDAKVERDYRSVAGDDKIESTDAAPFGREDMPSPASNISTAGSVQPFTIEGDVSKRRIISQVLPQYPEGLQKEANVKIRFKVLPDGSI